MVEQLQEVLPAWLQPEDRERMDLLHRHQWQDKVCRVFQLGHHHRRGLGLYLGPGLYLVLTLCMVVVVQQGHNNTVQRLHMQYNKVALMAEQLGSQPPMTLRLQR